MVDRDPTDPQPKQPQDGDEAAERADRPRGLDDPGEAGGTLGTGEPARREQDQ